MTLASLLAFAGLATVLALTPGPDTFLVLRYGLAGARSGFAAAFGCLLGSMVWALLVGVGVAALLQQSAEVYQWLKIAGGLYLVWLGAGSFLAARRAAAADTAAARHTGTDDAANTQASGTSAGRKAQGTTPAFLAGVLSSTLNPKIGLFFLALMPQFIPAGSNTLLAALALGALFAGIGLAYFVVLILVATRAVAWLRRPVVNEWLERVSSAVLAVLGIGVIASAVAEGA